VFSQSKHEVRIKDADKIGKTWSVPENVCHLNPRTLKRRACKIAVNCNAHVATSSVRISVAINPRCRGKRMLQRNTRLITHSYPSFHSEKKREEIATKLTLLWLNIQNIRLTAFPLQYLSISLLKSDCKENKTASYSLPSLLFYTTNYQLRSTHIRHYLLRSDEKILLSHFISFQLQLYKSRTFYVTKIHNPTIQCICSAGDCADGPAIEISSSRNFFIDPCSSSHVVSHC
jgi:hypothetical protein